MTKLTILSADDKLSEIRRLYFATTKATITADLARAVQLLKSMDTEEERERAAVYMDGLAQMRSDWARDAPGAPTRPGRAGKPGKPGRSNGPGGPGGPGRPGSARKPRG